MLCSAPSISTLLSVLLKISRFCFFRVLGGISTLLLLLLLWSIWLLLLLLLLWGKRVWLLLLLVLWGKRVLLLLLLLLRILDSVISLVQFPVM